MYIGLDIGTSAVKAVLTDDAGALVAQESAALSVSRPQPGWSEQNPDDWWQGCFACLDALASAHPKEVAAVTGIGLSGQMHGATLLDDGDAVLRPCILWNDGRSEAECRALEAAEPDFHRLGGNLVMPGFTAPKLEWVRRHEPEVFAKVAKVLLPKDWVRLKLTGESLSDLSDSAGTLWLDVAGRRWAPSLLAATGLEARQMPGLVEGSAPAGHLRKELAQRWGMGSVVLAGGGGDNAASACGIGVIKPGQGFLSLGTSGVLFACSDGFAPNVAGAVHAFCHALPNRWHQMGVVLSAAGSLAWLAEVLGAPAGHLVAELQGVPAEPSSLLFLPYLGGERTPHNDAGVRGAFVGLDVSHGRKDLVQAVLEGVAFAMADCQQALAAAGTKLESLIVVGGGARSDAWLGIMASVLNCPLAEPAGADLGAAFGAARLGRLAASGEAPESVCEAPAVRQLHEPDPALAEAYQAALARYRRLYPAVREINP